MQYSDMIQQIFTSSNSTTKTVKKVWDMFKVNDRHVNDVILMSLFTFELVLRLFSDA